jgi:ribonucleoside-diphosphate reductase beta chain
MIATTSSILDPGFTLTLRPMRYPQFYEMYREAIANTWSVEEIDLSTDISDLRERMTRGEHHLIRRLVAFFATGDTIVANNLVINLYKHINAPEARMYLSRQLFEEAQHIQFYLTLLDTYVPDEQERSEAFSAIERIPSLRAKALFCFHWIDSIHNLEAVRSDEDRRSFLMNLITFAAAIEGLFFFAAFAYVYFLRSRGLCNGLAAGTNWVFRDESAHMRFAFATIDVIRAEHPKLFDASLEADVRRMLDEAVSAEALFAADILAEEIPGLPLSDMRRYLEYVADRRLEQLGYSASYGVRNPLDFMLFQDVQELTNFFERRVSAYRMGVTGEVRFDEAF